MGTPRTLGAVTVAPGKPTPVFTGAVIAAASFSITNGIARIVLGTALPKTGYNGPNGYPEQNATSGSSFDIHSGVNGSPTNANAAGGQQVTLWGFTTATYFNGKVVSVIDCDPSNGSFRFYFAHDDVNSTADTGKTAACPFQHYRAVRLECSQSNSTDFVYVGDLNVSSTQYVAALSLAGQLSIEVAGDNIPADRIFIDGTNNGDKVQVSLIY